MVEEKKTTTVKKAVGSKTASTESVAKTVKTAAKKAPAAESAVWPFPEVEKTAKTKKAPAVKKEPAAKPAAKKPAAKKATAKGAAAQPSPEERYLMVQTAAYYIAERAGFQGCATDHWAAAEIEIAGKLGC